MYYCVLRTATKNSFWKEGGIKSAASLISQFPKPWTFWESWEYITTGSISKAHVECWEKRTLINLQGTRLKKHWFKLCSTLSLLSVPLKCSGGIIFKNLGLKKPYQVYTSWKLFLCKGRFDVGFHHLVFPFGMIALE